jgi:hypothetical protein
MPAERGENGTGSEHVSAGRGIPVARGDPPVIVEMREYTLEAGSVPEYLRIYEQEGLEIQRSILGQLVG